MSLRGRDVFDAYVARHLNQPGMAGIGIGSHVFNLISSAGSARIAIEEITEEVGPIARALQGARKPD